MSDRPHTPNRLEYRVSDTSPEADAERVAQLRRMSFRRKAELIQASIVASRKVLRAGIALRHPGASERQLKELFRRAVLGDELAALAYGPLEGPPP